MADDDVLEPEPGVSPNGTRRHRQRVFVSYARPDRPWAEWAGEALEADWYAVELDAWDWIPGDNIPARISHALERADHVVSLWSPVYFDPGRFTLDEWTALIAAPPNDRHLKLIPLRVAEVDPPAILRALHHVDLFDVPQEVARTRLLAAVRGQGGSRTGHGFPGRPGDHAGSGSLLTRAASPDSTAHPAVGVGTADDTDDARDPASWPAWAALLPHVMDLDPLTVPLPALDAISGVARYALQRGDITTALSVTGPTYRAWRARYGPDDPRSLSMAAVRGHVLHEAGRYEEAHDLQQATFEGRRAVLGPEHPDTLESANDLALDLRELGRLPEAYKLHRATHEAFVRVLGPEHPSTLATASNLAVDLSLLGRYEEAHDLQRATFDARRRILGPEHPDTLESANNLAPTLRELGRHQQAHDLYRSTLETLRRILGLAHPHTLITASNLAFHLYLVGRYQDAHDLDRATLETRRSVLGPDHPDTLDSAGRLAQDLDRLGRHQEAEGLRSGSDERRRGIEDPPEPSGP